MFVTNVNEHIQYALALGFEAGFKMPEVMFKNNLTDEQLSILESDYHWDLIDNAVIYRPDGLDISYVVFWTGEKFICHTIIINDKSVMNDGQGGDLTANCVTCFAGKLNLNNQLYKIAEELTNRAKDWKGFVRMDLILQDGIIYYKDVKFSIIEDYMYCLAALNQSDVDTFVEMLESGGTIK